MPHIYNFENCIGDIKEVKINPKGWINPITIEYGITQHNVHDPMLSIVWRVKGTTHTLTTNFRNKKAATYPLRQRKGFRNCRGRDRSFYFLPPVNINTA